MGVKTLFPMHKRTECLYYKVGEHPLFPGFSYLWVWPQSWVMVKAVEGETHHETCGAGRT